MKYGQCLIEDASGKAGIDFDGADVEAVKTIDEPTAPPGAGGGGGAAAVIGGVLSALSNTNSSYRRREYALAPDIAVYVLGEVREGGLIGKPASGSKNKTFVISHKSEEERSKALTSTTRWLLVIGVILLVLAAVLAGFGIKAGP